MQEQITLKVNGIEWSSWEEATLVDNFGATLCSTFELTLADEWRSQYLARPIATGMKCELWLGTEKRMTGWIDKVDPGYGPTRHGIRISGRDLTQDLVDCSSTASPGTWSNSKLEKIAADICAPFSIPVVAGDDTGKPIPTAALQVGETGFQFLEKLCRTRNVWLVSTTAGALTFAKGSTERLPFVLVRGVDIKEAEADFSDQGRFSVYIAKGQQKGSDTLTPQASALVTGQIVDPSITRYRPLIIQAEDQQNGETIMDRLKNEMHKRIGDSRSFTGTVAGWRMASGKVWPVNRRVAIDDDWLGLSVEYLVEQARFEIGTSRYETKLKLVPPEKFDISYSGTGLGAAIETEDHSRNWDRTQGPV
jgi:prophage tail gpP-like protein